MGKGEELWDDSALITAFDNAMSSYKKMHGIGRKSKDNSTDDVASAMADQSHGAIRDADADVKRNAATELGEAKNVTPVAQDNYPLNLVEPEQFVDSSSGQHACAVDAYSNAQDVEGYNQLLSQYYDLEEKTQKILHQLQQFGGYDYNYTAEGSGSSPQWGTCCASQDHLVPTAQPSLSTTVCSCCSYTCHCAAVPCTSFSACSFSRTCDGKFCNNSSVGMGPAKSAPLADSDVVKTAMVAAERAIASMKTISPINSGREEEEKEKAKDHEEEMVQNTRSETELSVVLNAWYSAGFYTGKYLTEQSVMKK